MITRSFLIAGCALVLTGCASFEGVYLPSCEAYAGSEIRLADGRFVWSKFTDQVVVDEDGNKVDAFPGFPLEGTYHVSGKVLTLVPGNGQPPETLYFLRDEGAVYLLSAAENDEIAAGGSLPRCALKRQAEGT